MIETESRVDRAPLARLLSPLTAVIALVCVGVVAVLFADAAIEAAARDGFVGAKQARDELGVLLAAGAAAIAGAALLAWGAARVAYAVVIAVAIGVAAGLATVSGQLGGVATAVLLLGWSWWTGSALIARLGGGGWDIEAPAKTAIATGLGLGILSFALLAVALLGILTDLSMALVLVVGTVAGWRPLRRPAGITADHGPDLVVEVVALAGCCCLFLLGFAVCLTPQVNFDALHYHLAMPLAFLNEGQFVERPDIIQSYFPLGLEMVYAPAFRLGGETAANLLHWAFAPMTAAVLWSAGNRCFGHPAGAIAAVLFASMPIVVWESTAATSDLALTFFLVSGVYLAIAHDRLPSHGLAFAAGLAGGLALSFKLVALLYLPALALVFVALTVIRHRKAVGRSIGPFALGGIIGGAPWLVLRWVQTGNPVLPLYNNIFRSDKWPPVQERFDLTQFGIGTALADLPAVFWEATALPARFGQETPPWLIGLPLLASVAALPLLFRLRRSEGLLWGAFAVAALLSWFFLSQYHRYGLPAFALLAPLAGFAAVEGARALRRAGPVALVALTAAAVGAATVVAVATFSLVPEHFPTDVFLGHEGREEYRQRAVPDYDAIRFFDASASEEESGAILGFPYNYYASNRLYDVIVPATLSPFRRAVESSNSPDELAAKLIEANVRWLIVDTRNPFREDVFPPAWLARSVFALEFVERHLRVAFDEGGVIVYRIE